MTNIPVIVGSDLKKRDVEPATDDEDRIVPVKPTDEPTDVAESIDEQIKKAIKGEIFWTRKHEWSSVGQV